jgi:hypothetical protein
MLKAMLLLMMGVWVIPAVAGEDAALPVEPQRVAQPAGKILWRTSLAALAAANGADVYSSWGKHELNPGLSGNTGRFGQGGALIKLGIVGGMFVVESLVLHHRSLELHHRPTTKFYRGLALINFASASVTGAISIRNLGVPRP